MASRRPLKLLHAAALVAVLLIAQTAAFVHSDLDDAHPAGEVCALCVGLATLGTGDVSAPPYVNAVAQPPVSVGYVLTHHLDRRLEWRFARDPPSAS